VLLLINPFIAIFQGLTQPNQTSIVSALASKETQGEILGIQQSMASLAFIFPPLIAGVIVSIDYRLPIIAAAVVTMMAWVIFFFMFKESPKSKVDVAVE
jgi:DHA1 family tetracycline resistance protein-like MFS transporter